MHVNNWKEENSGDSSIALGITSLIFIVHLKNLLLNWMDNIILRRKVRRMTRKEHGI
jgi:hypothetical protein